MRESDQIIVTTRPSGKFKPIKVPEGFRIINTPLTEITPVSVDWGLVRDFEPQVLIFTSTVGARIFIDSKNGIVKDKVDVIAIGSATARELSSRFSNITIPARRNSDGIVDLLKSGDYSGRKIAVFTSAKSNRIIQNFLSENNYRYIQCDLYDANPVSRSNLTEYLSRKDVAAVIITSSQEAELFKKIAGPQATLKPLYAIGETTASTMEKIGIRPSEPLGKSDLESLVMEICKKISSSN